MTCSIVSVIVRHLPETRGESCQSSPTIYGRWLYLLRESQHWAHFQMMQGVTWDVYVFLSSISQRKLTVWATSLLSSYWMRLVCHLVSLGLSSIFTATVSQFWGCRTLAQDLLRPLERRGNPIPFLHHRKSMVSDTGINVAKFIGMRYAVYEKSRYHIPRYWYPYFNGIQIIRSLQSIDSWIDRWCFFSTFYGEGIYLRGISFFL